MIHPAFDTQTDFNTRQNASAKQSTQIANEEKAKQQQQQQTTQDNSKPSNSSSSQSQSSSQANSNQENTQESEQQKAIAAANLAKTPTMPAVQAEVKSQLASAQSALSAQMSQVSAALDASRIVEELNSTLSALCTPIYAAIDMFKTLPAKLRSLVDIEGAAMGAYSQLGAIADTFSQISTMYVSSEVPITLDDYAACPTSYPKLESMQKKFNTITEKDCLSSGYTKVVLSSQTQIMQEALANMMNPTDQDIVAKSCEKMFESTIKTAWTAVQPPIQLVAGIANIGPLGEMVNGVVQMIDGIVQLAATPVPEQQLGLKIKQREVNEEAIANEADKVKNMASAAKQTANESIATAEQAAKDTKAQLGLQTAAAMASAKDAFAKMKMPPMPDGIDDTIEDIWRAVQMVVQNISNIFIVILFKLLEAVFKCFNQIIGVIGVPTLPYPLNIIPQLITNVMNIMTFILGLPMSLYNAIKAIVKRKAKAMVVDSMPAPPPPPVPEVVAIAPTSEDAPKIDVTWKDVEDKLTNAFNFSNAGKIVSLMKQFFNGSGQSVDVLEGKNYVESNYEGNTDVMPIYSAMKREMLTPQTALEEWLPQHIDTSQSQQQNGFASLRVPKPYVQAATSSEFYVWNMNEATRKWSKTPLDKTFKWEIEEFISGDAG